MSDNLYKELETIVYGMGGTFFGTSDVEDHLPEPLKRYPIAITFGVRLSDAIIDEIDDKPTFTYFNHYRSVNALIDQISLRLVLSIQAHGKRAYSIAASQSIPSSPIPYSGVFPHKTGAVLAGLGWIGKNGLFIHKDYGPRVRLGTVLTDMELPCENIILQNNCSSCNRCVKACPALALTGNKWEFGKPRENVVDARACSEYMNRNFKHIGRGSVCGICIKVCPSGSSII
ncbi:4Fe-4S double cluster binding domain-containing protein [Ruminiclostridium josui]|uniref:4Fe-4S double cluster binding domain-containing protein n=1 Tax=Ruminiclostridium josui TaxID=1499 RepID=UPI0004655254|nr:4Fe-4S double cluster binding domain-containing protein [Ruminiclostridium josui]